MPRLNLISWNCLEGEDMANRGESVRRWRLWAEEGQGPGKMEESLDRKPMLSFKPTTFFKHRPRAVETKRNEFLDLEINLTSIIKLDAIAKKD